MNENNNGHELQDTAVSALAAASKTPFKTAFRVTLGIGLARLALFFLFLTGVVILAGVTKMFY